jgi:3-oxoacyl-[acyl-carrier-protein] synthase III
VQHTRLESLGAYLPERVQATTDLIDSMTNPPQFSLEEITGIRSRRVHAEGEDSFVIALNAAKDCLSRSRYEVGDLDVVISASISRTKDGRMGYFEPSFAASIARAIGANTAMHFDVSNACAGMMTGVFLLDRMIKAGVARRGLVVSGEAITPIARSAVREISEPWDPQFGSLTVGDSGAAVVVDAAESDADKIHYIELVTAAEYSHLCIGKPSDKTPAPALYTNNGEMHKKERVQMWPHFQKGFLASRGRTFADERFDYIIQHQIGARAISSFTRVGGAMFETEMPESLSVVEELGNTATTSHFVTLYQHLKEKKVKKGSKVLMVPAASGIVIGCLSTTITALEA